MANHTPHGFAWYTGDPAAYGDTLKGKTVTGTDIYSASVRIALDDMYLLIGTPIKYHAPGARRPDKHQLLVEFTDGSAISCTVQMWGVMFCYRKGDEAHGIPQGHITRSTPTPLDDALGRRLRAAVLSRQDRAGRDTERDLFGRTGGYKTVLSKNTVGKACPICGTAIKKEAYLGEPSITAPIASRSVTPRARNDARGPALLDTGG